VEALELLLEVPPFRRRAKKRATKTVPRLLERDGRRLERAVDVARRAGSPAERDAAFHEARKKAKRLRYALESSVPLYGDRATRVVDDLKKLQDVLGEHQDSVVARALLHDYASQVHLEGDTTFSFGRLHASEEQAGREREAEFRRLWLRRPTRRLRRRLEK
jgi:CHAD domain-containing protein